MAASSDITDVLLKWKKAVVHLECVGDTKSDTERSQAFFQYADKLRKGEITWEQYGELTRSNRDRRYHGTALFLQIESWRYLITAWHVLHDKIDQLYIEDQKPEKTGKELHHVPFATEDYALDAAKKKIFSLIFLVPSVDNLIEDVRKVPLHFLMNLGAGGMMTYTINQDMDLAVVSLDQRNSEFADMLVSMGYVPITEGDIGDEPSSVGANVFSVGYPEAVSSQYWRKLHTAEKNWASEFYSVPTTVFGRVSMLHRKIPKFYCDFTNYPGNSGAPVIEDNRLVGIAIGQPAYKVDVMKEDGEQIEPTPYTALVRIPLADVRRAGPIRELLNEQIQKDKMYAMSSRRNGPAPWEKLGKID